MGPWDNVGDACDANWHEHDKFPETATNATKLNTRDHSCTRPPHIMQPSDIIKAYKNK